MGIVLDTKTAKATLRQEALVRRRGLPPEKAATFSHQIIDRALELPALIEAEVVLLFASFDSEVNTIRLLQTCLAAGQDVLLPRVVPESRSLDLFLVTNPARDLEPGPWGIFQPIPGCCPEVMPREVDFACVPGVAFDLKGNRLGYGGGYYDNLLPRLRSDLWPNAVAGLAFELQIVPEVPHKLKDVPLPLLVTEKRIITTTTATTTRQETKDGS